MDQWVVEERMRKAIHELFIQWRSQWFCTLNQPPKKSYDDAEGYLKEWRGLFYKAGIEIAYNGLWSMVPHHHVHLFMFGFNKEGLSLFDVEKDRWEKEWARLTKQKAVIRWINDHAPVTEYVSYRNTPPDKYQLLIPHNEKMLKRCKRK